MLRLPSNGLRGTLVLLLVTALLAGLTSFGHAGFASHVGEGEHGIEVRHERELDEAPRLFGLAGRVVHAGEAIDLRWSAADGVRELEILLSEDGGRHYRLAVSPSLDPGAQHFTWIVPELESREVRLLIRYNRNGREIEGMPSDVIGVAPSADGPEPLALPLPAHAGAPVREGARGAVAAEEGDPVDHSARGHASHRGAAVPLPGCGMPCFVPTDGKGEDTRVFPDLRPRFVPLRP